MFNLERWQEIFETLRKNKLRTFLTGLSVASGIFILVILLGVSSGLKNGITSQFQDDATNAISIRTGVTTKGYKGLNPGRRIQLKNEDFINLSIKFDDYLEYKSASYTIWGSQITYKNETGNYRLTGVLPDEQFIENADMIKGRFLNYSDFNDGKKVAVIGNKVYLDLFKEKEPLDQYISIWGINFKVIGVYTDPGGEREETKVFLPLTTVQKSFNGGDRIRNMSFTVKMPNDFNKAVSLSENLVSAIETDLKQKYSIHPNDEAAIRVYNTLENAQKIYALIDTITAIFWFIGVFTIIAGIVGVGNIMIIVVKERTKEIGIRKAIGAKPFSIIGMILHEAIFVTLFSGLVGLFFGLGLLEFVGPRIDSPFIKFPQVDFPTAIITIFILMFAGALAGFIPAQRAAKIKPIVALRDN